MRSGEQKYEHATTEVHLNVADEGWVPFFGIFCSSCIPSRRGVRCLLPSSATDFTPMMRVAGESLGSRVLPCNTSPRNGATVHARAASHGLRHRARTTAKPFGRLRVPRPLLLSTHPQDGRHLVVHRHFLAPGRAAAPLWALAPRRTLPITL